MGRPGKGAGPSATTRMEEAFFELLQRETFEKITVRMVVEEAGVNRNSFYYHYSNLTDLARSAVDHLLIPEIPQALAAGFALDSDLFDRLLATSDGRIRMTRVLTIVGANSTVELRDMLKDDMIEVWLGVLSLEREDLDADLLRTFQFILGGIFELLSRNAGEDPVEQLRQMRELPILRAGVEVVTQALGKSSVRNLIAGSL